MSKIEKKFAGGNPLTANELNQMAAAINDNDYSIASLREETSGLKNDVSILSNGQMHLFGGKWKIGSYYDEIKDNPARRYKVIPVSLGDVLHFKFKTLGIWGGYVYLADVNGVISYFELTNDTDYKITSIDGRIPTEIRVTIYHIPEWVLTDKVWLDFDVECLAEKGIGLSQAISNYGYTHFLDMEIEENARYDTELTLEVGKTYYILSLNDSCNIDIYVKNAYTNHITVKGVGVYEFTPLESNILSFYNYEQLGSFKFQITEKAESLAHNIMELCVKSQKLSKKELLHIKVAEWNLGLLNNGVVPIGIPNDEVATKIGGVKSLLTNIGADILMCTEYPLSIDRDKTQNTYEGLLKQFYPYHKTTTDGWMAICSKYPFTTEEYTSPDGRNYQMGSIVIGGEEIGFALIHPRSASGTEAEDARIADHQAVVDHFAGYDKVIVGGDFNTYEDRELDVYRNAGWNLGNCGYFGNIDTYRPDSRPWYIDNIVTKGINIDNFVKVDNRADVSDHYPVVANLSFLYPNR